MQYKNGRDLQIKVQFILRREVMLAYSALLLLIGFGALSHGAPRVTGGHDAPNHKYPFMVIVKNVNAGWVGSGTIVNKRWILTSADLGEAVDDSTKVLAGTNTVSEPSYTYAIESVVIHNKYVDFYHDNIALIRLVDEIVFNDIVKRVVLPSADLSDDSRKATMAGWGYAEFPGRASDKLQEVDVDLVPMEQCAKLRPNITPNQICTSTDSGKGMCYEDWGSPLFIDGIHVGIVSYMQIGCETGIPNVHTRVWKYMEWINRIAGVDDPEIPGNGEISISGNISFDMKISFNGTVTIGNSTIAISS